MWGNNSCGSCDSSDSSGSSDTKIIFHQKKMELTDLEVDIDRWFLFVSHARNHWYIWGWRLKFVKCLLPYINMYPPPTSSTTLKKKKKLHFPPDTWHLTCETWHVTHGGGWTFSKNVSSPALTVWDRQCLEDFKRKDHRLNQWMTKVLIEQNRLHWVC